MDTGNAARVGALAASIFWLVLISLALFISLPFLIKTGLNFYLSLGLAIAVTVPCYFGMIAALGRFGVRI